MSGFKDEMSFDEFVDKVGENPHQFGLPTFEEFRKNPERYKGRYDDEIAAIDRGDPMLGCFQKYYIQNAMGKTYGPYPLELIESVALDMGLNIHHDFIKDPQLKPDGRGGFFNEVTFRPNPNALVKLK